MCITTVNCLHVSQLRTVSVVIASGLHVVYLCQLVVSLVFMCVSMIAYEVVDDFLNNFVGDMRCQKNKIRF